MGHGMDMGMDMDAQEEETSVLRVLHAQGYMPGPLPCQQGGNALNWKGLPPDANNRQIVLCSNRGCA